MNQQTNYPQNQHPYSQYYSHFHPNQQSRWNCNRNNLQFSPGKAYNSSNTHPSTNNVSSNTHTSTSIVVQTVKQNHTSDTHVTSEVHYDPIPMTLQSQINNTPCLTIIDTGSEVT